VSRRGRTDQPRLVVIWWRDIPAQVVVRTGRHRTPIILPERFQKAIDRAAARAGKTDFDEYLQEWREEVEDCGEDADQAARARTAELETAYDEKTLAELVDNAGWSPGSRRTTSRRADIEAAYVDTPPVRNPTIVLADSDPQWTVLYAREERRIRNALGELAVIVEHTGSTAVPGLAAKPIIDITVAVPDSADEPSYVPDLEAAGYRLVIREPDWYEHRVFKGPDTDVNLHVFTAGCPEIDRMTRFRDWLRSNPDDRELYETTKRRLAAREWEYVQNYADAKSKVVEEILRRAGSAPPSDRLRLCDPAQFTE
jgi:GrpB-like predicted nucleotidyltransferase (UPF0157 family)